MRGFWFFWKVSSWFTFSQILSTWNINKRGCIEDWLVNLLFAQFWIQAKITGDSEEIWASIEQNLGWLILGSKEDGSNVACTIFVGKIHSESWSSPRWSNRLGADWLTTIQAVYDAHNILIWQFTILLRFWLSGIDHVRHGNGRTWSTTNAISNLLWKEFKMGCLLVNVGLLLLFLLLFWCWSGFSWRSWSRLGWFRFRSWSSWLLLSRWSWLSLTEGTLCLLLARWWRISKFLRLHLPGREILLIQIVRINILVNIQWCTQSIIRELRCSDWTLTGFLRNHHWLNSWFLS